MQNVQSKYRDESAFSHLSIDFGSITIVGNAVEFDVLRRAGMENADVLFATTSVVALDPVRD